MLLDGADSLPDNRVEPLDIRLIALIYALPPLVLCFGYVWMARRMNTPLWRWGAIAKVIAHAATPILLLLLISISYSDFYSETVSNGILILLMTCVVVPSLMILAAAWGDRRLPGVHWTHWLGLFAFVLIYVSRLSVELRAYFEP